MMKRGQRVKTREEYRTAACSWRGITCGTVVVKENRRGVVVVRWDGGRAVQSCSARLLEEVQDTP